MSDVTDSEIGLSFVVAGDPPLSQQEHLSSTSSFLLALILRMPCRLESCFAKWDSARTKLPSVPAVRILFPNSAPGCVHHAQPRKCTIKTETDALSRR